jgi:hypothetical protein
MKKIKCNAADHNYFAINVTPSNKQLEAEYVLACSKCGNVIPVEVASKAASA